MATVANAFATPYAASVLINFFNESIYKHSYAYGVFYGFLLGSIICIISFAGVLAIFTIDKRLNYVYIIYCKN